MAKIEIRDVTKVFGRHEAKGLAMARDASAFRLLSELSR